MARYLLSLDQGTTSSRALLFNDRGVSVKKSQKPFTQYFRQPGWVEHDPQEIWQTQIDCAREAIAGYEAETVAIGIANQRETTVVWNRSTGLPIAPAIVWQDRRTATNCQKLIESGHAEFVRERTGLPIDPYFSATKIAWLLDHIEGARAEAEAGKLAFGTVDTFLLWKLTEGKAHATDPTNASRTLLFDLRSGAWSSDLCELFGIPMEMLPEIRPSSGTFGISPRFGREIPILGVAGDQQAATFGQACFNLGSAKNTYGTGCFLLINTGHEIRPSRHGMLTTAGWKIGESPMHFAMEGSVFMAGASLQWLCEELKIAEDADEVELLARSVSDSGGVVMVPAFAGLGAPHWDSSARGTILGLTRGSGRAEICRAAMDSIVLQTYDLVRAMEEDLGRTVYELRVDGGGAKSDFLMQLQADMLDIPVVRPAETETTSRGAAFWPVLRPGFGRIQRRFRP